MPKDRKAKAKKERQKKQKAALQKMEYQKITTTFYRKLLDLTERLGAKPHMHLFDSVDLLLLFKTRTAALIFDQVGHKKALRPCPRIRAVEAKGSL